ncbi:MULTISPECIES: PEP-CTERM sorting domain-containing protein [unclassified Microcoleus]|uniref:PEP-CTERM sorting domain-containing protein n=1 Tax=unclassified Microcoleus TaxID=2642155 RepID=UPI002FD2A5C6
MNPKQRQRLGSAIASTLLSYAAVSLAGVDQAQAAVLSYNFSSQGTSGFFKVDNSSLTGIGYEGIAVSEGRLNTYLTASAESYQLQGKDYYDLVGATVSFYQGEFLGLEARGGDTAIREIDLPDVPGGPFYVKYEGTARWQMANNGPFSLFWGYKEVMISNRDRVLAIDRGFPRVDYAPVSYTLVDTAAEPVPEPLTAGGTALALAGLSWLKHKKKMAA